MKLLALSGTEVRAALPMHAAIEAMRTAFASLSDGTAVAPARTVATLDDRDGTLLMMGADVPGAALTAKVCTVFHGNAARGRRVVNGLLLVLDPETGEPAAICDAGVLTAIRTGAAGGLAADLFARAEARVGAVIGTGVQARTQLAALDAVRDLEEIRVHGREPAKLERFVEEASSGSRARVVAAASAAAAIDGADVVVTATSSPEPVFDGASVAPGVHVTGVGSFTPSMREVDGALVGRARIFIDDLDGALAEAGDLIQAEAEGLTERGAWTTIGAVVRGTASGRTGADEVTFFKSVGHAVQDAAAAAVMLDRARAEGLGRTWEL